MGTFGNRAVWRLLATGAGMALALVYFLPRAFEALRTGNLFGLCLHLFFAGIFLVPMCFSILEMRRENREAESREAQADSAEPPATGGDRDDR